VRFRQLVGFTLIGLIIALAGGCASEVASPPPASSPPPAESTPSPGIIPPEETESPVETGLTVSVVITTNFGEPALVEQTVTVEEGISALDVLPQVTSVETKYGGGFVSSIAGLSSRYGGAGSQKEDWFFYINGMAVNTGAGAYLLLPGDVEHWDYHDWSFRQFIPAIIGDFPEPFLHGHGGQIYPTLVVYQDGREEAARRIADRLAELGVADISLRHPDELTANEQESGNLILLGDGEFELIKELNEPWDRLGFYAHFEDGCLAVYDAAGQPAQDYEVGAGLIQATQNIWNPKGIGASENVVWMVTGLDEVGISAAVDTLVGSECEFKYACAIVIAGGKIIRAP
jgi:hypothetical protein